MICWIDRLSRDSGRRSVKLAFLYLLHLVWFVDFLVVVAVKVVRVFVVRHVSSLELGRGDANQVSWVKKRWLGESGLKPSLFQSPLIIIIRDPPHSHQCRILGSYPARYRRFAFLYLWSRVTWVARGEHDPQLHAACPKQCRCSLNIMLSLLHLN